MRPNRRLPDSAGQAGDPREAPSAEVIDLATRAVLPQVSQRRPGREGFAVFSGIVVVGLLGLATFWSLGTSRTAPPAAPAGGRANPPSLPALPPQAITPLAPARPGAASPVLAAAPQPDPALSANPAASPVVVFDAGTLPQPGLAPPGTSALVPAPTATGNGNEDFASRLGTTGGGAAVAAAGFDPRSTVTQGTLIPAVLETAIDTDVPGFVRAVVSVDVRSFDGSRVLVPRSSRLIGQYRSGVQAGQKRAYVIWTRLIRPDGVSVAIGSPAIAFSGETGLSGKVSTHFFEKFGSAMLLSVVGGLSAIGSGGTSVVIAGGGQSAAAAAVGQTGQIGPTIRVRQGQPIRVFTARDLDFSKVANP